MKEYIEDKFSKALYKLNQEHLVFRQDPNAVVSQDKVERLWKNIFRIGKIINRKILNRDVYDDVLNNERQNYSLEDSYEMKNELPNIVVYTCILGKYDELYEPLYWSDRYKFYVITDSDISSCSKWEKIDINRLKIPKDLDVIRKVRYIKTHPHLVFPHSDVSIWIDGNIIAVADMIPLILQMKEKFFGIHLHPDRRFLATEAKAVVSFKRTVNKNKLYKQIDFYEKDGYKDNIDLLETTILIRKHNDESCIKLMEDWWSEIIEFSTRDQISLPYVLWKNNISLKDIYILGKNLRLNPRFRYLSHRRNI